MLSPLRSAPFVLLDDSRANVDAGNSLLFTAPSQIIRADTYAEIAPALAALDTLVEQGHYVAGFIAYEVGLALEAKLFERQGDQGKPPKKANEPLIWLMVCDAPTVLSGDEVRRNFENARGGNQRYFKLSGGKPFQSDEHYHSSFRRILELIDAGDVYQVNYTGPIEVAVEGDSLSLYENLRSQQPVALGAFIDTGDDRILSLSPEQFIKGDREKLVTKPMKGTARRGRFASEDDVIKKALISEEKNRAENLMIVDLIRNDLSRITKPGSVTVSSLFDVETLPSVHQMTSTVEGEPQAGLAPSELLAAMFPCGSVTGAPKIRAMEIIDDLEDAPRGVYCGAIGYFGPNGQVSLNVPIRTLIFDKENKGRLHIGSGVVADSDPVAEYNECLLKAKFIQPKATATALVETMAWTRDVGFNHLDLHLARLESSMVYIGASAPIAAIREQLETLAETLVETLAETPSQSATYRVRLLVDINGSASVEAKKYSPVATNNGPALVAIADQRVNSSDPWLFHKFAERDRYTQLLDRSKQTHPDIFDCLLVNERGEITEGSFTNVFADFGEGLVTPLLTCGLLPGVLREHLIATGQVREGIIEAAAIRSAKHLYLGNSLRGLIPVKLTPTDEDITR